MSTLQYGMPGDFVLIFPNFIPEVDHSLIRLVNINQIPNNYGVIIIIIIIIIIILCVLLFVFNFI
jgi:hypothetical protein